MPTKQYAIVATSNNGEWLIHRETDSAETALKLAASMLDKIQKRRARGAYAYAVVIDVMQRNKQGDYNGLCSFYRRPIEA
jgi:hypothetical protein